MSKKLFSILVLWFLMVAVLGHADLAQPIHIVLDAESHYQLPKRFRATNTKLTASINQTGLDNLQALASAQFSELELAKVLSFFKEPLMVIDLRQESHGFLNGNAISWYGLHNWANQYKANQAIVKEESQLLANLQKHASITIERILNKSADGDITNTKPIVMPVNIVITEQQLVKRRGLQYQRFFVTDRQVPSNAEIDRFVELVKSLPKSTLLYFHCRAGKGRTTTFMVLYDILRNGKQVSLEDIVKRQAALGGIDLFALPPKPSIRYTFSLQRIHRLKQFYRYVITNKDDFKTSWSEWLNQVKEENLSLRSR